MQIWKMTLVPPEYFPRRWEPMDRTKQIYKLFDVDKTSEEFCDVVYNLSHLKKPIRCVFRVQHPLAYTRYIVEGEKVIHSTLCGMTPPDITEEILYHALHERDLHEAISQNCDVRYYKSKSIFTNIVTEVTVSELQCLLLLKRRGKNPDMTRGKSHYPILQHFENIPNGLCVCLVYGEHRTLVANVGSSTHFSMDFLHSSKQLQELIEKASLIHVEGYFLSGGRFEVCKHIVENLQKVRRKLLSYNLNARYVCETLTDESSFMAENADILIGNHLEFKTIGRLKYNTKTVKDTIIIVHDMWRKSLNDNNSKNKDPRRFGKIFAVTHNSEPVIVAWGTDELQIEHIPVPKIESSEIADTTGAGDTFMAGFMHAILNGLQPVPAARYGAHVATLKIRHRGSEMPPDPAPQLNSFIGKNVEETAV